MEALAVAEFRRLDRNSEELGVPLATLMANAGNALAKAIRKLAPNGPVVILCGKGNNGGDGFAAAGLLHRWNIPTQVVLLESSNLVRGAAKTFLELLPDGTVATWQRDRRAWSKAAAVVDCMLGTGVRETPRSPYDQAIRWTNKHAGKIIACDVPTGMGTSLAVKPHTTITFHAKKQGMTKANSGTIQVADIGIPHDAGRIGLGDLDAGFVRPGHESHKGQNGRVLIIGGGPFRGAPHYAGMGAVRSGADLVHVATTQSVVHAMSSWGPDLLLHGQAGPIVTRVSKALLARVDALVIGPGLGTAPASMAMVHDVLEAFQGPVVIDADGLAALDAESLKAHGQRLILTPHKLEAKRLLGKIPSKANVQKFAREYGCTVLLKGAVDLVTDGERIRENYHGHPAMTVGGTGDVLAGACGALLAKGASAFDAACAAAYLVGGAGEIAAQVRSYGMTATDLHEALPMVLTHLA